MNRDRHRLIPARRGPGWVPVAEFVRARSAGRGRSALVAAGVLASVLASVAAWTPAWGASLPVPVAGPGFVTRGAASVGGVVGQRMTIRQTDPSPTVLNWQSFDIAPGHVVQFVQPTASARAINLIGGASPSVIRGGLEANGQVLLFNHNGIVFGDGAEVNVGGLVASALRLNDKLIDRSLSALNVSEAALSLADAAPSNAAVRVEPGARLVAARNGRVLLAAPEVSNAGTVQAPEGQIVLAAGQKVYLADALDARLRGFLVEVDAGGTASNLGRLLSERGNTSIVGLAVRQMGEVSASSSASLNGSIRLLARDTMAPEPARDAEGRNVQIPLGQRTGELVFGSTSVTQVLPDAGDDARVRDDVVFNRARIEAVARRIVVEDAGAGGGARIQAPGGEIELSAQRGGHFEADGTHSDARIYLGRGALIDSAGLRDVAVPVASQVVEVELRGAELADAPLQRDPAYGRPLYGQKIWVDLRQGTPLANIEPYRSALTRGIAEKSARGGDISLISEGDVLIHRDATVDVSGGSIAYQGGAVPVTMLVTAAGRLVEVAQASPETRYAGLKTVLRQEMAYIEGRDAGTLVIRGYGLALDGRLLGLSMAGIRQRTADTRPRGGRLLIGNAAGPALQTPEVQFAATLPVRTLSAEALAPGFLTLPTSLFSRDGFSRLNVYSDGAIRIPAGTELNLPAFGELALTAREISVGGALRAPGGQITLRTQTVFGDASVAPADHDIEVAAGATLDVSGTWTNDWIGSMSRSTLAGPIVRDGGRITLEANADLRLAAGGVLAADGGAWLQSNRSMKLGAGGAITLGSGRFGSSGPQLSALTLDGSLSAYGSAWAGQAAAGGMLTLDTSRLQVVATGGITTVGELLTLPADFFDRGGFRHFDLNGEDGLLVAAGARIEPKPQSLQLPNSAVGSASGQPLKDLSAPVRHADDGSRPVTIALSARSTAYGDLDIREGASLTAGPQGSIELAGEHRLTVAGSLSAPAGRITLGMSPADASLDQFDPARAIFLTASARLDAQGYFRPTPGLNFRDGELLSGGTIELDNRRGFVVAQAGAQLNVSGVAALLDLPAVGGRRTETLLASDGGTIGMQALDGIYSDATLLAGPGGAGALGGLFTMRLTQAAPWITTPQQPAAITRPREIRIGGDLDAGTAAMAPGQPLDAASRAGAGVLAWSRLAAGGFADVDIGAQGRILFAGSSAYTAPRSLLLDAPNLVAEPQASVALGAYSLRLQNGDPLNQFLFSQAPASGGTGTFSATGDVVDVLGNLSISGFGLVSLAARGDLRFSGVVHDVNPDSTVTDVRLQGGLISGGDLDLAGRRIYPSSASAFTLALHNRPDGWLRFLGSGPAGGPAAATPLSAGGALTAQAANIVQAGNLYAPFGSIALRSESLTRTTSSAARADAVPAPNGEVRLEAGGLTAVGGGGQTIPFGQTVISGRDWVYPLGAVQVDYATPPAKSVSLAADRVTLAANAVVDVAGGGDLYATEFIPGRGGSKDILDPANAAGRYAILPGFHDGLAPYDLLSAGQGGLKPGDAIRLLDGAAGLPAGDYTLLPARYALLPGARLITLRTDMIDALPGVATVRADDILSVAAQRLVHTVGGASSPSGRRLMVDVLDGSQVRRRAEYVESLASRFYAGTPAAELPGDAGSLALRAGSALRLDGVLNSMHEAGRRGARLDITAPKLAVSADELIGYVTVAPERLAAIGADSLLLGATRTRVAGGWRLDADDPFAARELIVDTPAVDIHSALALRASELLLVAKERLDVREGSVLAATTASSIPGEDLAIVGDGALLRLAAGEQGRLVRTEAPGAGGDLNIGAGARLVARSAMLDASRTTRRAGTLELPESGGALALSARSIGLGDSAPAGDGIAFSNAELASFGTLDRFALASYGAMFVHGAVTLGSAGMSELAIDAAGLVAASDSAALALAAQRIVLGNAAGRALSDPVVAGQGRLALTGDDIVFADGVFRSSGFGQSTLQAARTLSFTGQGRAELSGSVAISAGRVGATAGADHALVAAGALTLGTGPSSAAMALPLSALGGKLELSGRSIEHAGDIDLPAGLLRLVATGTEAGDDIVFRAGSRTSVAGMGVALGPSQAPVAAGRIDVYAQTGNVIVEGAEAGRAAAVLDVSGHGGGDAGSLSLAAPVGRVALGGVLQGAADAATDATLPSPRSGRFDLDARELVGGLDAVASATASFQEARRVRARQGDLLLTDAIRAREVALSADAGDVRISGLIDASGPAGGRIELSARPELDQDGVRVRGGDVVIAGSLLARAEEVIGQAFGTRGRGGEVVLEATPALSAAGDLRHGSIQLGATSRIDVGVAVGSAATGGRVSLRAARTGAGAGDGVAISRAAGGSIEGAADVHVEGTKVIETDHLDTAAFAADNATFMSHADAIRGALGLPPAADPGPTRFHVRPHVELRSTGNLSIDADTNLTALRTAGEAGTLSLRAQGDVIFAGSLSDGFSSAGASGLLNSTGDAWSYRIAAGADLAAASFRSLGALAMLDAAAHGDVRIEPGKLVRSGRASIDIAAGRDLILGDRSSTIYTAGIADGRGAPFEAQTQISGRRAEYPKEGGDVSIRVQRDLVGPSPAQPPQLFTSWQYRQGRVNEDGSLQGGSPALQRFPTWWVRFDQFKQGIATFGGGNLTIEAGRDIRDLGASVATTGRVFGTVGQVPRAEDMVVLGGGDLSVTAGGDILSAALYAGRGRLSVTAGGRLGSDWQTATGTPVHTLIALGEASAEIRSRGDATLERVATPQLLPQVGTNTAGNRTAYFSTYAADSALALTSTAGDITLLNGSTDGSTAFAVNTNQDGMAYPPSVALHAPQGGVEIAGPMVLLPSAGAELSILARDRVSVADTIKMVDSDPAAILSPRRPGAVAGGTWENEIVRSDFLEGGRAHDPLLARTRSARAISIVSALDDIVGRVAGRMLVSPKPVVLSAGRDIVDAGFVAQHLDAGGLSQVIAGRDIRFTTERDAQGNLIPSDAGFVIGGAGSAQLLAGRDIDMGNAAGVVTRGNLINPFLPEGGAGLVVQAGSTRADFAGLLRWLNDPASSPLRAAAGLDAMSSGLSDALASFVAAETGMRPNGLSDALAGFEALPATRREAFYGAERGALNDLLFAALRQAGIDGGEHGSNAFQPGFDALAALYPHTGAGSLNLFYSQLKTEQGGGIDVLVPFGEVHVGLPNPGNIGKPPAQQGIFVIGQGDFRAALRDDFLVNQSRVFTLGGGDLMIWSSRGDIDAGGGAKTAAATPPPQLKQQGLDALVLDISATVSGSGIGTLKAKPDAPDGDVLLFAPAGVVDAGDAGIRSSGEVRIAAQAVLGANNIQAGSGVVGVAAPPAPVAPPAALGNTTQSTASQAESVAQAATGNQGAIDPSATALLTVEVVGLGPEPGAGKDDDKDEDKDEKDGKK